ncbi:MAG: hypothetical protein IT431_15480 [Phycisphaerales bacterium]|nr:hypothetical protein [Phycisphaerales bacterium]
MLLRKHAVCAMLGVAEQEHMGRNHHETGEHAWSDIDDIALRKALRDRLDALPDSQGHAQSVATLRRMSEVVQTELGSAYASLLQLAINDDNVESRAGAQRLADRLNQEMAGLGLAVSFPTSGAPARLGVAATPPPDDRHSWFQVEPLDTADRTPPHRLPFPLPRLPVCAHLGSRRGEGPQRQL